MKFPSVIKSWMNLSYLESLPYEILFSILLDRPVAEISRVCRASSRLAEICRDWNFWADKAKRDFELPRNLFDDTEIEDPRHRYREIESYQKQERLDDLLVASSIRREFDWLRYFINHGATQDALNEALDFAAGVGDDLDIVKYLIENGATYVNLALVSAASHGNLNIAKYLVSLGQIRPNILDDAISTARATNKLAVAEYLESLR